MPRRLPVLQVVQRELEPAPVFDTAADHREVWEPSCVMCDRRASEHATPVEIGGELVVPACELLHPGGLLAEGPAPPPTTVHRWKQLAAGMPLQYARSIALSLGGNTKMPGATYGLDAWECKVGEQLSTIRDSVCHGCYARKNFYKHYWPAVKARKGRQQAIRHPLWAAAMIVLIRDYVRKGGEPYFRWHDSGDLQSVDHLEKIIAVCEATPNIKHWLPTREYGIVRQFLVEGGRVPPNLALRLSAHFVGTKPKLPFEIICAGLPTSTVHEHKGAPVRGFGRTNASIECRAYTRGGQCGPCRACWTPTVQNVSYPLH